METKPGYKTTEFWLTVAVSVASFVSAVSDNLSPKWAALAAALANGLYAVGRGQAKSGVKPDGA
jgi:hypothetical protein